MKTSEVIIAGTPITTHYAFYKYIYQSHCQWKRKKTCTSMNSHRTPNPMLHYSLKKRWTGDSPPDLTLGLRRRMIFLFSLTLSYKFVSIRLAISLSNSKVTLTRSSVTYYKWTAILTGFPGESRGPADLHVINYCCRLKCCADQDRNIATWW